MITALDDSINVNQAFKSGCEAYIVKPFERKKIISQLHDLGLDS